MTPHRRSILALAAGVLAAGPALARSRPQPKPGQTVVIDGKTVHLATSDPAWKLLNSAKVTTDRKKGTLNAAFPAPLMARGGQAMEVRGFILPIVAEPSFDRFLLTKTNYACGFCPPPLPTETIEVRLKGRKTRATLDEVKVRGRLELVASNEDSVFYRLHDAALL